MKWICRLDGGRPEMQIVFWSGNLLKSILRGCQENTEIGIKKIICEDGSLMGGSGSCPLVLTVLNLWFLLPEGQSVSHSEYAV